MTKNRKNYGDVLVIVSIHHSPPFWTLSWYLL